MCAPGSDLWPAQGANQAAAAAKLGGAHQTLMIGQVW